MAKIDMVREIRRAVDSGRVVFGQKQSEESLLNGKAKVIVTAKNIPKKTKEKIMHEAKISGTHVIEFEENGLELGSICGKPFNISVLAITEAGKSNIMAAFKKK